MQRKRTSGYILTICNLQVTVDLLRERLRQNEAVYNYKISTFSKNLTTVHLFFNEIEILR